MAVLKLDDVTLQRIINDEKYRKQYIKKLSEKQQEKLVKAIHAWADRFGLGGKKFAHPLAMAKDTQSQAWGFLDEMPHLQRLSLYLAKAIRAGRHVAIEMPPRQGKSTLCSVWTPLWLMSEKQRGRVMLLTYADTFASQWGETVRNLVQEYGKDWGLAVDPNNTAKKDWKLTNGGFMLSAGISGQVIGRGCDLLVCDDLMKEQDAHSPIIRDNIWRLFEGTALSRVEPGGTIIVIMQRFHEDDIIGRLTKQHELQEGLGKDFSIVRLPAMAEKQDALGREEGTGLIWGPFTQEFWEKKKELTHPDTWSAIYQQRPSPAGGGHVKLEWFEDENHQPTGWTRGDLPRSFDKIIQTWDFTLKDKQTSDYTAALVLGIKDAMIYVLDGWIAHASIPEAIKQFFVFRAKYRQNRLCLVEDAASGPAFMQVLRRRVTGIVAVPPQGSKLGRLKAAAPAMESRNVLFPVPRPRWAIETIAQLCSFPKHPHDDAMDALTQGLNWLDPIGYAEITGAQAEAMGSIKPLFLTPEQALIEKFHGVAQRALKEASESYGEDPSDWSMPPDIEVPIDY